MVVIYFYQEFENNTIALNHTKNDFERSYINPVLYVELIMSEILNISQFHKEKSSSW